MFRGSHVELWRRQMDQLAQSGLGLNQEDRPETTVWVDKLTETHYGNAIVKGYSDIYILSLAAGGLVTVVLHQRRLEVTRP